MRVETPVRNRPTADLLAAEDHSMLTDWMLSPGLKLTLRLTSAIEARLPGLEV
jgi:hypothetical protein